MLLCAACSPKVMRNIVSKGQILGDVVAIRLLCRLQARVYKKHDGYGVDLHIKYHNSSLAEESSASALQALKRSSSIFTSVYMAVQKLKKALARASVQLDWQC
ncbi:hypothetical protein Tco_0618095 [Tanacetum coccineum]